MTKYYSEYGEDRFLAEEGLLKPNGTFVDIGAADGVTGSNTMLLEEMGWQGLCVEADLRWYHELSGVRKNCLFAAVAEFNAITEYYLAHVPTSSGIAPPEPEKKKRIHVPCLNLQTILEYYHIVPDLLSLDTEGTEVDILNSFNLESVSPGLIIIEYLTHQTDNSDAIHAFFRNHPVYRMIHQTKSNQIWMRKL